MRLLPVALLAAAIVATPAAAVTFNLGGANLTTANALTYSAGGVTATVTGRGFGTMTPNALLATSKVSTAAQLAALPNMTAQALRRTARGLGVCSEGGTGSECAQVDTNGAPNELLIVSFTGGAYRLTGASFGMVDNNDTLRIYGVRADGSVVNLGANGGFGGQFLGTGTTTALTGGATGERTGGSGDDQRYKIDFANTQAGGFTQLWFTSRLDAADGYRLENLTVAAVPEPATWGMMLLGFGLVGAAARRRRGRGAAVTA